MKQLFKNLLAIACMSAGAVSFNSHALDWYQSHKLPEVLAQTEVVSTVGCRAFRTPGMNRTVKNIRIWKSDSENQSWINSQYRAAKKKQKRIMSTIKWDVKKCADWDNDYVELANKLSMYGYGSKVKFTKPKGQPKLTTAQEYGYLYVMADFCNVSGSVFKAMDEVVKRDDFDSNKISEYGNAAFKHMKKMGKGVFCQSYGHLAN